MTRRFLARGLVQGVGFRWFVARSARKLGLTGYVRNLPDGAVEVVATGDAVAIDALARALGSGPPGAAVARVEVENLVEGKVFKSFDIQ